MRKNDVVMAQVKNNSEEVVLKGNLPSATKTAVIQALGSHQELAAALLKKDDQQSFDNVVKILCRVLQRDGDIEAVK